MQETSALYQQIIASPNHRFETKVETEEHASLFGEDDVPIYVITERLLHHVRREKPGMDGYQPTAGNVFAASLDMEIEGTINDWIFNPMEEFDVYVRAIGTVDGVQQTSEWIPQGVYFLDTREYSEVGTVRITAYDAMLKTEKPYPDTNHAWPYKDIDVLREIAQDIDVTLDQRTIDIVTAGLMIELPADYTEREVLGMIASAYAGNFIITDANKLLLVPIYGTDDDNLSGNYLADDDGTTALMMGDEGWFILV